MGRMSTLFERLLREATSCFCRTSLFAVLLGRMACELLVAKARLDGCLGKFSDYNQCQRSSRAIVLSKNEALVVVHTGL